MAADAVAVLDDLGWESTHVVGSSMGGMIAQAMAINHPTRVRTLTSLSSTPSVWIGARPPRKLLRAMNAILAVPVADADQAARREVAIYRLMGSPGFPLDEEMVAETGCLCLTPRRRPPAVSHPRPATQNRFPSGSASTTYRGAPGSGSAG
jgi:pimeloyl-ACP methyl ester carboxylesterase